MVLNKRLLITDKEVDIRKKSYKIPWNSNAAAFNMHFPKTSININANDDIDLETKLGNLEEITTIFIECSLKKEEYNFLKKLKNIEQIYISEAKELDNIEFISDKGKLQDLCITYSKISDLCPLVKLMKYQSSFIEDEKVGFYKYKLKNVAIRRGEIEDLSCFKGFEADISEFNLQGNKISDLKALEKLNIYYANFSDNKLVDVEDFMTVHSYTYLMNFKNNLIQTMDFISDIKQDSLPRRFFIDGNPIKDYSPFRDHNFLHSDIPIIVD